MGKPVVAAFAAVVCASPSVLAAGPFIDWADPVSGSWYDATRWSTGAVPHFFSSARITATGANYVVDIGPTRHDISLNMFLIDSPDATIDMHGRTMEVIMLDFAQGTFGVGNGARLTTQTVTHIGNSASLSASAGGGLSLYGELDILGRVHLEDGSYMLTHGGMFHVGSHLDASGSTVRLPNVTNSGALDLRDCSTELENFVNQGSLTIARGSALLGGMWRLDAPMHVEDADLTVGGAFGLGDLANIQLTGLATAHINDATINLGGNALDLDTALNGTVHEMLKSHLSNGSLVLANRDLHTTSMRLENMQIHGGYITTDSGYAVLNNVELLDGAAVDLRVNPSFFGSMDASNGTLRIGPEANEISLWENPIWSGNVTFAAGANRLDIWARDSTDLIVTAGSHVAFERETFLLPYGPDDVRLVNHGTLEFHARLSTPTGFDIDNRNELVFDNGSHSFISGSNDGHVIVTESAHLGLLIDNRGALEADNAELSLGSSTNNGTILARNGSTVLTHETTKNHGLIRVVDSMLTLDAALQENTGTIEVVDSTVQFNNLRSPDQIAQVTPFGNVQWVHAGGNLMLDGATLNLQDAFGGQVEFRGNAAISNGSLTAGPGGKPLRIGPDDQLSLSSVTCLSPIIVDGGAVAMSGTSTLSQTSLEITDGSFGWVRPNTWSLDTHIVNGALGFDRTTVIEPDTMIAGQDFVVPGAVLHGTIHANGGTFSEVTLGLNNQGTVRASDGVELLIGPSFNFETPHQAGRLVGGTWVVDSGATMRFRYQSDPDVRANRLAANVTVRDPGSTLPILNNLQTIESDGAFHLENGASFTTNGWLAVEVFGSLHVVGGGEFHGRNLHVRENGMLTLDNESTVELTESFSMAPDTTLQYLIVGKELRSTLFQTDQWTVLDGVLRVQFANPGQWLGRPIELVSAAVVQGRFQTTELLNAGFDLELTYTPTNVTLKLVPTPSSIGVLALPCASMPRRRRPRSVPLTPQSARSLQVTSAHSLQATSPTPAACEKRRAR